MVVALDKKGARAAAEEATLVEVGPRACLNPIKMFAGSFGGPVVYENQAYVSPNEVGRRGAGGRVGTGAGGGRTKGGRGAGAEAGGRDAFGASPSAPGAGRTRALAVAWH